MKNGPVEGDGDGGGSIVTTSEASVAATLARSGSSETIIIL